jgi:hypothetical protein
MMNSLVLGLVFMSGVVVQGNMDLILAKVRKPVEMNCTGVENITWKKRENLTSIEFENLEKDDNLLMNGSMLTILRLSDDELGVYGCFDKEDNLIKEFDVSLMFRMKKMKMSVAVDIGGNTKDELKCTVTGAHEVVFRWFTKPEISEEEAELTPLCGVENDNCLNPVEPKAEEAKSKDSKKATTPKPALPFLERLTITNGVNEDEDEEVYSLLQIDDAQLTDRQIYVCQAVAIENKDSTNFVCEDEAWCEESETIVRVKDPLAALWPFLGIVAEVIILCLVIFICERRQKDGKDEDGEDDNGYAGNNVSSNSSLRQRK